MSNASDRWLAGPVPDLLFGCGMAYVPVLFVLIVAGPTLQTVVPLGLLPFGSLLLAVPHYGATLLRVYERAEDRNRYRFFTLHLTVLIWGLFLVGLFESTVGSVIYTLYLTWSPWHYAGQNYGLASMFLRRRGVEVTPFTRRALHASFVLSFALAFLAMHIGESTGAGYAPTPSSSLGAFRFYALGLPAAQAGLVAGYVFVAYVACLIAAAIGLLRNASLADIGPSALLVLSQALWFTVPVVVRGTGISAGNVAFAQPDAQYAFWWIIFAHSIQYLWVARYFARSDGGGRRYFTRAMAAGAALYGLPVLFLASTGLSPVAHDAGLALLVNAAVNLHHFVLDGAIWKLRDGSVARVLLRPVEPLPTARLGRRWAPWCVAAVAIVAILYTVQFAVSTFEREFGVVRAVGDVERLQAAERRLERIRLPSSMASSVLGIALADAGRLAEAEVALEKSLDLHASAMAWTALGQVRARRQDWSGAAVALSRAIALDPEQGTAFHQLGQVRLATGDAAAAIAPLERALALVDAAARPDVERLLERARSASRADVRPQPSRTGPPEARDPKAAGP